MKKVIFVIVFYLVIALLNVFADTLTSSAFIFADVNFSGIGVFTHGFKLLGCTISTSPRTVDCSTTGIGGVPTTRTISTSSPLGGGGALSSNLTLTCTTCLTTSSSINDLGDVTITSATTNDVLQYNGSAWVNSASGGSGAPTNASYITEVSESGLSAEFAMASLGTGLVKNTTTTGVPSIYAGTSCSSQALTALSGAGAGTCSSITEAFISLSDVTTDNSSTSNHGFLKKLDNTANHFMNGQGNWVQVAYTDISGTPTIPTDISGSHFLTDRAEANLSAEVSLGALTTGLLLNTVSAGVGTPSAYAGTSCTNQFPRSLNASGAATCASVSLTADVTNILGSANGGTGNGFTKFSGPASSEKTFTLPNADSTIFTTNDRTGNTTTAATGSGSYTNGHCIKADANSNLVDSGTACGSGSSSVTISGSATGDAMPHPAFNRRFGVWQVPDLSVTALTVANGGVIGMAAPAALTNSGTFTNTAGAERIYLKMTCGSGSNTDATSSANVTRVDYAPKWCAIVKTDTSLTNTRFTVGVGIVAVGYVTTLSNSSKLAVVGYQNGSNSGNFYCETGDGTTLSSTDIGLAAAASTVYRMCVDLTTAGHTVCSVTPSGGGTSSVDKTSNQPPTGTSYNVGYHVNDAGTGGKSIYVGPAVLEQN